ncbi:benzoyl-CoA reductase/2-hydroxyglutaryl-CoA dehydratase subunit BcrC/BadD/HgdB [Clostridium pascui]|uniref:(R)-2-hydroxyisocaproyl-CoA dehydratase subunit HadB n=1 Tax=Clostridium pascui TaxID=46609 RepID=UPI00195A858A|nr:(R)-2-hydroxyisocaproyl-CoA dehydratase subunit HadB [Clostridium pascui]MBM7871502.1 benzoyl-CoA reductase/2-hydroxyglutaryl-CoA dehydratase subunit BcrC/BadD/HgdB [Clostridium pascui]
MADKKDEKKRAAEVINGILAKSYADAWKAREEGKPVGWATSVFPQELVEAFGLDVLYPENQAAGVAAKKESLSLCEAAESIGYSIDLCAYARTNFGLLEKGGSENLNMPKPDFICCCNNICNQVIKWYENIAKELDIPLIMIDTTFNNEDQVTESRIKYLRAQFEEAIKQLEKISGRKFDPKKLEEVMKISAENGRLWKYSMSLPSGAFPSPMNGFDLFTYMAVIVCYRGKKETTEAFKLLISELEENIKNKQTSFRGEEKYRIMMEGIPCWPYIGYKMRTLSSYGVNMTGSVYPHAWALQYEANDLDGMARAYSSMFNNVNLDAMSKYRIDSLIDGNCDGAFYHMNRSCKLMSFIQYEMERKVFEETGIPYAGFDGDQADPRSFSKAQFETRLQALVEVMEERKKGGDK